MNIPTNNIDASKAIEAQKLATANDIKSSTDNDKESLEAVAQAFEKMVFNEVFSFTPIAKGDLSNLGFAQEDSIVNDLFKEELHSQSKGMLMDMFIKQM